MNNKILFIAGDYEATKFCQRYYTPAMIQDLIFRHFLYSFLIADSVIIPAGCYFESKYTTNLVDKYHNLFMPLRYEKAVAGLAIGDDRESFLDDVAIKAGWYPKEYKFSDKERTILLSNKIDDLVPVKRMGKMRRTLTESIMQDIIPFGGSFQVIQRSGYTIDETSNILEPLKIIVNEQKYALLPPYTQVEIDKQHNTINRYMQKTWLDFVLFKNYTISCETSYEAYCNNPLSVLYGDLFKSLYSFRVDYRDTLLFERFLSVFPLTELANIQKMSTKSLFEVKYSDRFMQYLKCYKSVVKRMQELLSIHVAELNYQEITEEIKREQLAEYALFKKRIAVENTLYAEILYRALNKTFRSQILRVNAFKKWLRGQDIDLPLIEIMSVIDDTKNGLWANYINELAIITKERHKERRRVMNKNTMLNIFSPGSKMLNKRNNSPRPENISRQVEVKNCINSNSTHCTRDDGTGLGVSKRRFAIAISFPGEYRDFVKRVAEIISNELGRDSILYDEYHMAEFSRPNLDIYLQNLYANESELIAVFLCGEYNVKTWCGVEWRAIRTLLNDKNTSHRIMLIKINEGEVDGVFGTVDGFLTAVNMSTSEVANAIIERYRMA